MICPSHPFPFLCEMVLRSCDLFLLAHQTHSEQSRLGEKVHDYRQLASGARRRTWTRQAKAGRKREMSSKQGGTPNGRKRIGSRCSPKAKHPPSRPTRHEHRQRHARKKEDEVLPDALARPTLLQLALLLCEQRVGRELVGSERVGGEGGRGRVGPGQRRRRGLRAGGRGREDDGQRAAEVEEDDEQQGWKEKKCQVGSAFSARRKF